MQKVSSTIKRHLTRSAFGLLFVFGAGLILIPLTLADRRRADVSTPNEKPTGSVCFPPAWTTGPDMPTTGVRMVGVYFPANGNFYAVGGRSMDGAGNDLTHPFEYDPSANSWAVKSATYPDNQVSNMACGVLNAGGIDYIYCVGGSAGGQTTATDRVFRYNPVSDTIESIASPWPGDSDEITLPGGFAVFNNKLYILGGFQINTAMTNTIWEFDPATNIWSQKAATLPVARGYIPTVTYFNFIYTAGGSDWNGTTLVDTGDSFKYDPVADSITTVSSIPRATGETRAFKFAGFVGNCAPAIWVMGGGRTSPNPSNEVNVLCPDSLWFMGPPFVTARRNFPADTDIGQINFGTAHIWLAGGYASDGVTPLSSMEIYCSSVPTPSEPPPMTPTATATATPTPTLTPPLTPSPTPTTTRTPRIDPTPRHRPTPAPRP